jgi:hypothetical protein
VAYADVFAVDSPLLFLAKYALMSVLQYFGCQYLFILIKIIEDSKFFPEEWGMEEERKFVSTILNPREILVHCKT